MDYSNMTRDELVAICLYNMTVKFLRKFYKQIGINVPSKAKKDDLMLLIKEKNLLDILIDYCKPNLLDFKQQPLVIPWKNWTPLSKNIKL